MENRLEEQKRKKRKSVVSLGIWEPRLEAKEQQGWGADTPPSKSVLELGIKCVHFPN